MKTLDYFKKKYPDSIGDGCISLYNIKYLLDIYNILEQDKDYNSLNLLGLSSFKNDLRYIGYDSIEEYNRKIRKEKLDSL